MQQFVPCNGCGNPIRMPNDLKGHAIPPSIHCEYCGLENVLQIGQADGIDNVEYAAEPTIPIPQLELEIEPEAEEVEGSPDWNLLGPNIRRSRPREASAIRKIVPPLLGGLAAFPIATLIMWYGFGRDIGFAGPIVAEYVPWIVPKSLRNYPIGYAAQDSSQPTNRNRSSALPRKSFPSLNIEDSADVSSGSSANNGESRLGLESNNSTSNSDIDDPRNSETSSISETIARLRTLQKGWNEVPMANRSHVVREYYEAIRQLSEQSSKLSAISATVWRRELESISKEILSHPTIPTAIQRGAIGELPTIAAASIHDFIATVIKIGAENEPSPNDSWTPLEKWPSGKDEISIEILPGAWRAGGARLPARCLVFGQLVQRESSQSKLTNVVLRVHAVLPQ